MWEYEREREREREKEEKKRKKLKKCTRMRCMTGASGKLNCDPIKGITRNRHQHRLDYTSKTNGMP